MTNGHKLENIKSKLRKMRIKLDFGVAKVDENEKYLFFLDFLA